ncbi:MAG: hypothetical protein MI723_01060 [Caulobacterales bacterium]|nr:hypothetical protein [Caulobacterales bacterium]
MTGPRAAAGPDSVPSPLGRAGARWFAAGLLGLSLAAAVQAHVDLRATSAQRAIAAAELAGDPGRRAELVRAAAAELEGWTATGDLRDLNASLELIDPNGSRAEATRWSRAALARGPARGAAWARIAFADTADGEPMGATAREALRTSFLVTPYGSSGLQRARLEFVLRHWAEMDGPDRRAALRQIDHLVENRGDREWLRTLPARIEDEEARRRLRETIALYES